MIPLFLAVLAPAHALTDPTQGVSADATVGWSLSGGAPSSGLAVQVSGGFWAGRFDDAFALGRYWQIGPTIRVDAPGGGVRVAPMLELRRGVEVLVAGVSPFLAGGLVTGGDGGTGWTVRGGLAVKYRWHRYHGGTIRFEAGTDVIGGTPTVSGGVMLGFAFSRPVRPKAKEVAAD